MKLTIFVSIVSGIFLYVGETAQSPKSFPKPIPGPLDAVVYPGEFGYNSERQHNHYHYHHHPEEEDYDDALSQKPNNNNNKHDDAILKIWNVEEKNTTKIPLSFINEINNKAYTVNDFLLHYVEDYEEEDKLSSRFGQERDSITFAKDAKCMPELKSVQLIENTEPGVMYIPSCIRIERCGGCCMHEMLSCQPNQTETINVKVIKVMYAGGKTLKYVEKQIIPTDVHKSCKCGCKITSQDCTAMQFYDKNECKCGCKNVDEEKKCFKENSTKLWNPNSCTCQCKEELMCTTGSVFDWRDCKCVVKQVRRRNVDIMRGSRYRNRALSVAPFGDYF